MNNVTERERERRNVFLTPVVNVLKTRGTGYIVTYGRNIYSNIW